MQKLKTRNQDYLKGNQRTEEGNTGKGANALSENGPSVIDKLDPNTFICEVIIMTVNDDPKLDPQ